MIKQNVMKNEFGQKQIYITLILSVIFGATSLVDLGNADFPLSPTVSKLRYFLVGMGFILLCLMNYLDNRKGNISWGFNNQASPLLWIWLLFCFALVISSTIHQELISIRDSYWLLLGVPFIFFRVLPKLMADQANQIVSLSLVLGHLPYLLTSWWRFPPYSYVEEVSFYRGVYANSNQMGFSCVVISVGLFILMVGSILTKKPSYYTLVIAALLLVNLVTICYAYARTSLITFLLLSGICLFFVSKKRPKSFKKVAFVIAFLFSLLLYQIDQFIHFLFYDLELNFAEITGKKSASLSGRDAIWLKTWQDWNFFGHGIGYHEDRFGLGAHNTIVTILGNNGLIAAYVSLFFVVASFFFTYKYFKSNFISNYYAIGPWLITVCFWTLSIGEDMFGSLGKGITLAYFASLGVVMNKAINGKTVT